MIIDTLENAGKYTSVHPLFAKAFEFLNTIDLNKVEAGKYEISDGLNYVVVEKEGMTADESISKFECHNKNIDIQLCISGKEKTGLEAA
jgi:biofilm protein TabA